MSRKKKVTRGNPANNVHNGTMKPKNANMHATKPTTVSSNWKPSGSVVSSKSVSNVTKKKKTKVRWNKVFVLFLIVGMSASLFASLLITAPTISEPVTPYNAPDIISSE